MSVFAGSSVRDRGKKGGNEGRTACTGRFKGVPAVRPGSVAGGVCYGDMGDKYPVGLSQKEMKIIGRNSEGSPKGEKGST